MALAQYSDTYWFPTGTLAASVPARVFQHNTNTLATLWSDAGGTVPLANPVSTSATGVLEFWAEEGRYWVHIDSEAFEIAVGALAQTATQQDITNHTGASDPHADRAYADGKFATIVAVNTLTGTVTTLSGQVASLDTFVQDALNRVAAIEQGTAVLTAVNTSLLNVASKHTLDGTGDKLGFHGVPAIARQTINGSRGGNAALASLLTALATLGLVTDSTTA